MKIPRDKPARELVNITPLIDVVFILLVFFMLAGAIEKPDAVEVAPPRSTSTDFSEAEDEKDLIVVLDADGRAFIEGEAFDDAGLTERVAALLAWRPDLLIHLKADGQGEAARMIEVMEALRLAGAEYVVLIAVGGAPAGEAAR